MIGTSTNKLDILFYKQFCMKLKGYKSYLQIKAHALANPGCTILSYVDMFY